jgi:mono/diheme cytochrome c family protein
MTARILLRGSAALLLTALCVGTMRSTETRVALALSDAIVTAVEAQGPDLGTEAQRASGKVLYDKNCAQCHGDKGDGDGYATPHLFPKPRNFTSGKFKVRTTPNGALPTQQDLINIIRRGMPYTSMPAWPDLSDSQLADLAYYIKTFYPDFASAESVPTPVELPSAPASTDASIELGKKLYVETGCVKCHGNLGRGDGASAPTLMDELGQPIRAADLSLSWTFRGGSSREDIFRTMTTGLNGTPMPSFTDALTPEQRWAITDYISSLSSSEGPAYKNLVVAKLVLDKIDLTKGAANFASAPAARFPVVGQIMEPGRQFHPPATSVVVQAIYDEESIAFLVRWHDMRADKTGTAGLTLPVTIADEVDKPAAAPAADAAADPFAEQTTAEAPPSEFNDAVAIQVPSSVPTGARKPYFIFGDAQGPVDLWFFDLGREDPLQFTGRGSADIAANDTGDVTGTASYDQGEWSVIFKRPLRPSAGAEFAPGGFLPIAFSVWDGFSRERGNRRALTSWYSVYVEPEVVTSAAGPMVRTALLILLAELLVIGLVRRAHRSGARAKADPPQSGYGEAATSV